MSPAKLALIIPAWKTSFLQKALESVERQTGTGFSVYIFDDAGPAGISEIVSPFLQRNADWRYHRFSENMGMDNLSAHWNRCIQKTTEDWVWLFSDDDEMEADCIPAFFRAIESFPNHQVYRFGLSIMDEKGQVSGGNASSPEIISGFEFGRMRFFREFSSAAVEFIFARSAFDSVGGFPQFPAAWCADDAAWISFSGADGIRFIPGPLVRWRFSPAGISGSGGAWTEKKTKAAILFICWFNNRFPVESRLASFRAEQVIWLRLQLVHQDYSPGFAEAMGMVISLKIPGISSKLRAFQDLYCLSYVYACKVVKKVPPKGFRLWLSQILPAF
jgi:hypothetical protein